MPLPEPVQPAHHQMQLLLGRHLDPVGRPEVDAENADVVGGEPVAQVLPYRRSRENGTMAHGASDPSRSFGSPSLKSLPIGRLLDRDHALEHVGARGGFGHVAQGRLGMRPGVVGDRVAVQHFAPGDLGQFLGVAADVEERRANALGRRARSGSSAWFWPPRGRRRKSGSPHGRRAGSFADRSSGRPRGRPAVPTSPRATCRACRARMSAASAALAPASSADQRHRNPH